jgi:hypothetical protein
MVNQDPVERNNSNWRWRNHCQVCVLLGEACVYASLRNVSGDCPVTLQNVLLMPLTEISVRPRFR